MKYETREVKVELNVVQITCSDERWYQIGDKFVPSVTWITGHYPKGIAFYKWLAGKGWDESQAIKNAAGNRGSKVHNAIENLLKGKEVKMDDKYSDRDGEPEELTVEEWEAIMSFAGWFEENKPEVIKIEQTVYSEKHGYAGTVDLICKIGEETWIIDFKTSAYIWPEHELQISAYKEALEYPEAKLAILQLGYGRNKKGFKFTEVENKFNLFLAAKEIWANECKGQAPAQKDYPLSLKLTEKEEKKEDKADKIAKAEIKATEKKDAKAEKTAKKEFEKTK